jgi:transcriptional regulator
MLLQRYYAIERMAEVRRLIAANGWALLATAGADGLRASHLPCLLDPEHDPGGRARELVIVGHTARADPTSSYLSEGCEALLVFQGPHGYISAAWYERVPSIPTWNFTAVHVYGVPQVLEGEEGFAVLERTVEQFEAVREEPWRLAGSMDYARRIAPGTVPFRLRATRVEAKAKLSQDKPPEVQDRVIAALERSGPYHQPRLAEEMRRVLDRPPDTATEGPPTEA